MHSFEAEAGEGGDLNIDILPNRVSDASAHLGIAREISALLGYEVIEPGFEPKTKKELETGDYVAVDVEDKKACPRYMALLVKGTKVGPSPEWLKKRLAEVGQKSINNIVDIMNYVMLETGQPLHAFDLDKLGKKKIIIRKAVGGEKIETLDNKKISLPSGSLIIADDKDTLAIAGIKGGKKAEITKDTKDIIIEAAVFDGLGIRRTSRTICLKTDASFRFEHGISYYLPGHAIKRAAALVQEIAGGDVAESAVDISAGEPRKNPIIFYAEDVSKILGEEIKKKEIEKILKSLSFSVKKEGENYFVKAPLERTDVNTKEDIVEEIARVYGYENIPSEIPAAVSSESETNEEYIYSNWVRGVLYGLGFTEVYNYSFLEKGPGDLKIENPLSGERAYLRGDISTGLGRSVNENLKYFDEVKLFEIGRIFSKEGEKTNIAFSVGYKKGKKNVAAELKGAAGALFITDVGKYIKNDIFEIDLNKIIEAAKDSNIETEKIADFVSKDVEFRPFSKFPPATRDISIFVPVDTKMESVEDVIENTAGELLTDSDLFDEYMPPDGDQKSLAFRLIFQSFEKTLTDKEINQIMREIIKALEENKSWQVRKK